MQGEGAGVEQPSQRRYVHYFEKVLARRTAFTASTQQIINAALIEALAEQAPIAQHVQLMRVIVQALPRFEEEYVIVGSSLALYTVLCFSIFYIF
jgi:hypothetical protein